MTRYKRKVIISRTCRMRTDGCVVYNISRYGFFFIACARGKLKLFLIYREDTRTRAMQYVTHICEINRKLSNKTFSTKYNCIKTMIFCCCCCWIAHNVYADKCCNCMCVYVCECVVHAHACCVDQRNIDFIYKWNSLNTKT